LAIAQDFRFTPCRIRSWTGYYARIEGDSAVFHVQWINGRFQTIVYWHRDDARATCVAVDTPDMRALTEAVLRGKRLMGSHEGGSYQINEFAQVLVPSSTGDQKRVLGGEVTGTLRFHNPYNAGQIFTLADDNGLSPGDLWPFPYIGMPFHLSKRSFIYYWREDDEGGYAVNPLRQDRDLVMSLRDIRRYGAVRFIVNSEGLVLTRRPPLGRWQGYEETWEPVYVGRIDYAKWFEKGT